MTKKSKKKTKKKPAPKRMSERQFVAALNELGLTVASQRTAQALGLRIRQVQRIAAGDAQVPGPVEKLLTMYLKHGLETE